MSERCELQHAAGVSGVVCEKNDCTFWRLAGHLGISETADGCAIQYFELLDRGPEMVSWLLSVKQRADRQSLS